MPTIGHVTTNLANTQSTILRNSPTPPKVTASGLTSQGVLNNQYIMPNPSQNGSPVISGQSTSFGASVTPQSGAKIMPIVNTTEPLVNQIVVPISTIRVIVEPNKVVSLIPSTGSVHPSSGNLLKPIAPATTSLSNI